MAVHILGIRHHGVGSAQMVKKRLEELQPDYILVEGPPEITESLAIIGNKDLQPPVAIMVYDNKNPAISSFYPFTEFSPEFVATKYANKHNIPIQAIDLPIGTVFKQRELETKRLEKLQKSTEDQIEKESTETTPPSYKDPLSYFADIAGFQSGEAWWEFQFEQSKNSAKEHFEAVMLTMKTLREENIPSSLDKENIAREAYMRNSIQSVKNEMYENIVVICGAWHAPVLADFETYEKEDAKILKKLPKSKVAVSCSWIPWTNARLSLYSGYGAGLTSPGWYEHRWKIKEDVEINWLTKIAKAFRKKDIDISTAHVLETYKLAHSLAALRNKPQITLAELNESISTVMCMGDNILFELVKNEIIIGDKIGSLPEDLPKVPLQSDFEAIAKKLRLRFSAMEKQYDLDLRKPLDLQRSIFFHQLAIIGITWASPVKSRSKGTFKESWLLCWDPAMQIDLIDKAYYGNTVVKANEGVIAKILKNERLISTLIELLQKCIPAELFNAIDQLLIKINNESAISTDTQDLMKAIPNLVNVIKYGDVRKSDISQLESITNRLLSKIYITLPNTCYGLDEENSNYLFELISKLHNAIQILENGTFEKEWYSTLDEILQKEGIHSVITGCTVRLLLDSHQFSEEEATQLISYYLSPKQDAEIVAFWIEGFLRGSRLILIYDNRIWNLLYNWVDNLEKEQFMELLPVLRRAFSKFPFGERRQIGEKAKQGFSDIELIDDSYNNFDYEQAEAILPFINKLLQPK